MATILSGGEGVGVGWVGVMVVVLEGLWQYFGTLLHSPVLVSVILSVGCDLQLAGITLFDWRV